ncbi:hypothetical protein COCMIDRAFT_30626 [Bipolaris oryzae ATCC 44560]|uniref:Uncharacterized protein n=1 Tax=Bipolaris oryzae ATCC 44560 TaxID=930090 RepID=W6YS21_COCMI|nr:uncharacterized protein COCMIDRAFT_30626 [Bipolaris oryzae ATCC 44560]EUC40425.1 hypothetical protein COCMIDRAFT_30626 [Bipolaris oryzae ATCC 44560]
MTEEQEQSVGLLDELDECKHLSLDHEPIHKKPKNGYRRSSSIRRSLSACVFLAVIFPLALWGMFDASSRLFHLIQTYSKPSICWCGTSDAEAIAMGCIYDHLAVDWLPRSCIDDEIVSEFESSGSEPDGTWPYFRRVDDPTQHPSHSYIRINTTEIDTYAKIGKDYYSTLEWHVAHCMFTWRKQFRTGFTGKRLESWSDKESHIMHCSDFIIHNQFEPFLLQPSYTPRIPSYFALLAQQPSKHNGLCDLSLRI